MNKDFTPHWESSPNIFMNLCDRRQYAYGIL